MQKALECLGEIMKDGHINIPENEKQGLNWKAGNKIRLIILSEDTSPVGLLQRLQGKGLIKAPTKEGIKSLNKRKTIYVKGEPVSETVIKLRGEK
ncbi:MAG: hypothetical protein HY754_08570 [Nitrospirae bacterium]|nr:hypothetical protein [Nitrospirota bacterium]